MLGENLGGTCNLGYAMSRKASQKKWCLTEPKGQIGISLKQGMGGVDKGVAEEAAHAQRVGIREQEYLTVEKIIVTFTKMENSGKETG